MDYQRPRAGLRQHDLDALKVFDAMPASAGVSPKTTGVIINKGRTAVHELCKAGILESRRIGGSRIVTVGSIRRLLAGE